LSSCIVTTSFKCHAGGRETNGRHRKGGRTVFRIFQGSSKIYPRHGGARRKLHCVAKRVTGVLIIFPGVLLKWISEGVKI